MTKWIIDHNDRHTVRHALCVAVERYETNARELREAIANPMLDSTPESVGSLEGLADQFDRQAADTHRLIEAFDAATIAADGGTACRCDDCGRTFEQADLAAIKDIEQRLDAGGTVPAGECPECGALAYVID